MRESLTQALSAYTGTLLLVTHDRYLMQTLGCPILYLENGKATFYRDFAAFQKPQRRPCPRRRRRRQNLSSARPMEKSSANAAQRCGPA